MPMKKNCTGQLDGGKLNILCMYLVGQLSGRGDDHSPEAQVGRLLQVGKQWETESQSLS